MSGTSVPGSRQRLAATINSHGRASCAGACLGGSFERHCRGCPLASRCTTAKRGRKLTLHEHEQLLRAARAAARDPDWQAEYRQHRPMVERTIAWLTRDNRRVPYRGVTNNDHWLRHRVAGLNLRRLITLGLTHESGAWALT